MAGEISPDPRRGIEDHVIERAGSDPEFRAQLVADPRAALASHLGVNLPDALSIRVQEERPGEVILVLPADHLTDELSLQELESVAGGGGYTNNCECSP